ncbi:MAG TPA: hypothetical protein VFS34_05315, partial [Thermoanaerobaculia bacterium]|nr:hypothetical protein [Thermoanaerobaculia bacterium]
FLAIRGVVDAAGDEFPDAVRSAWTENGVDRLAVVVRAILRPREIPALLRLRRRTRRAMEAIAGILPAVLRAET